MLSLRISGISAPPCLRKSALEENQVIKGYYARLNDQSLPHSNRVVNLSLKHQNDTDVKAFENNQYG